MNVLFKYVYGNPLLLMILFGGTLGCEQDDLKKSFLRICESRKNPIGGGMRKAIKDPADLTGNVDCQQVSDMYHDECKNKSAQSSGASGYSAYINCMQRKAVVEGTKQYLENQ